MENIKLSFGTHIILCEDYDTDIPILLQIIDNFISTLEPIHELDIPKGEVHVHIEPNEIIEYKIALQTQKFKEWLKFLPSQNGRISYDVLKDYSYQKMGDSLTQYVNEILMDFYRSMMDLLISDKITKGENISKYNDEIELSDVLDLDQTGQKIEVPRNIFIHISNSAEYTKYYEGTMHSGFGRLLFCEAVRHLMINILVIRTREQLLSLTHSYIEGVSSIIVFPKMLHIFKNICENVGIDSGSVYTSGKPLQFVRGKSGGIIPPSI